MPKTGTAKIVPKKPNNLAPTNKEIKTKTGGTSTSFFINKGVNSLFSISCIINTAIITYKTTSHEPDETAIKTINNTVVIHGPIYGIKFITPETIPNISA